LKLVFTMPTFASKNNNISWVFVCQAGPLERQAAVLATSLRSSLGPSASLVAAVPQIGNGLGLVSKSVLSYFDSIHVSVVEFTNRLGKKTGRGKKRGEKNAGRGEKNEKGAILFGTTSANRCTG